jgi:hypothetical protein
MKKMIAGGAALTLAGVGAVALAGPLGAQEDAPLLSATVSPNPVEPGAEVTVNPAELCPSGTEYLGWWVMDEFGIEVYDTNVEFVPADEVPDDIEGDVVNLEALDAVEDGAWSVTFNAPQAEDDYFFVATCWQEGEVQSELPVPDFEFPVNPCWDPEFPGEDVVFPEDFPEGLDFEEQRELLCGEDGLVNDVLVPEFDPCAVAEFADLNEGLCVELPLCENLDLFQPEFFEWEDPVTGAPLDPSEIDFAEACTPDMIHGLVSLAWYDEGFTVGSATTPAAPPVAGTPQLTG